MHLPPTRRPPSPASGTTPRPPLRWARTAPRHAALPEQSSKVCTVRCGGHHRGTLHSNADPSVLSGLAFQHPHLSSFQCILLSFQVVCSYQLPTVIYLNVPSPSPNPNSNPNHLPYSTRTSTPQNPNPDLEAFTLTQTQLTQTEPLCQVTRTQLNPKT